MARIPTYGSQQAQTEVVRGARAGSVASGAFGAPIAQGLGQLGQGVADMQQRIATTEAEEAMVKFEREKNKLFFDPDNGYFNTQGRTAYDSAATANEALMKLQQQHADSLSSDVARQMFTKSSNVHVRSGEQDIMRHASKGIKAWEVATIEAQVENSIESASLYWNEGVNRGATPTTSGDLWERLKQQESGNRQLDSEGNPITSDKGATGIAQIMPATGPEAAELAGVEWDPERFKYDADYNEALGKAYFDKQMQDFEMPVLAAAAYNAGPGRVQQWIKEIGDPRTGEISVEEFAQKIPFEETRNYVNKVVGVDNFAGVAPDEAGRPDRLSVQRALGRQAVIDAAEMQGITGEALNERLQTFESSFAAATIEAAITSSSADGKRALQKYGSRLEGPARAKAQKAIEAKAKTERVQYLSQQAVMNASGIIRDNENRADVIAAVNEISDPELRDKTMSEAMYLHNQRKLAESEARAESFESAESFIAGGGSAEQFQAQNPEAWERLSPKQQKTIQAGTAVATDWTVFSDLMTMDKADLANVDPTDYYDQLAPAQRKALISAVRTAQNKGSASDKADAQAGRSRTAQTTAAVETIYGPKPSASKGSSRQEYVQKTNAFYSLLDAELHYREQEKGSKLTSAEYTALLGDLTRKVVLERPWYLPDTEMNLGDVPTEDVPALSKFLRDNGIPVTSDNLIKAYEQAK